LCATSEPRKTISLDLVVFLQSGLAIKVFGSISEVAGFGRVGAREFDEVAGFGWWARGIGPRWVRTH
jgi:hypothetical protein